MTYSTENLTNIDEELAKKQPDYLYNGEVPQDTDVQDYVKYLKGVRLG